MSVATKSYLICRQYVPVPGRGAQDVCGRKFPNSGPLLSLAHGLLGEMSVNFGLEERVSDCPVRPPAAAAALGAKGRRRRCHPLLPSLSHLSSLEAARR